MTDLPDVYLKFTGADPAIRGESNDAAYTSQEGWICIKSFGFGFGWSAGATSATNLEDLRNQLVKEKDEQKRVLLQKKINALEKEQKDSKKSQKDKKDGGKKTDKNQLQQRPLNFTKSPGVASKDILLNLIKKTDERKLSAEVVVCRAAGVDIPHGVPKAAKTPFLRLVFSECELTDCKLQISRDQPPSESVELWFGKVQMETLWTDNETGEKLPGGKNRITYDFQSADKDEQALFEGFLEP